jgi:broad specificity phosphatase PhoE
MNIVLVRHGEPNYQNVTDRRFIGHGRDLAELTCDGIKQAETASKDVRLSGAELIVSSPYTRALQIAAIISKNTGLDIKIETDLHEWLPDLTYQFDSEEYAIDASHECHDFQGVHNKECKYSWEKLSNVADRAYKCLYKYLNYNKIIVVSHGIVMRQFVFQHKIPYCGILETEFILDTKWQGFIKDN